MAVALKAPAGIALPFVLIAHRSWRGIGAAAAAAAGVAVLATLAFGSGALGVIRQIA